MKWEAGGGEEEQAAGGEQVEEVWEASSSDDMSVITSSKLQYVYNCACPDTIVNSILKTSYYSTAPRKMSNLCFKEKLNIQSNCLCISHIPEQSY